MCLILIVRISTKLNVVEGLDTNDNNPYKFKHKHGVLVKDGGSGWS